MRASAACCSLLSRAFSSSALRSGSKEALQAPDTDTGETSETESSAGNDKNQANKVKYPVVMVRHKTHNNATLLIHEPVD